MPSNSNGRNPPPPDPFKMPKRLTCFPNILVQDHRPSPSYAALMAALGVDVLAGAPPEELEGGCVLHRPVFAKPTK